MTAERNPSQDDQMPNEPAEDARDHAAGAPESGGAGAESGAGEEIIELEPLVEAEPAKINEGDPLEHPPKIRDVDVCPNCSAPLVGESTVVCLRCGFDLRKLASTETRVGPSEQADESDREEPVAPPAKLRVSISWTLAAVAALALIIGLLAGVRALFPGVEPVLVGEGDQGRAVIARPARWIGALKFVVSTLIWFGCAFAALVMFARLVERRLGSVSAAGAHILATVTAMQLARYWDLSPRSLEWTVESATTLAVFLGLSVALLNISRRDVITYALITVLVFLCLLFGSHVITWAMG